jgi:UPF0271 protein
MQAPNSEVFAGNTDIREIGFDLLSEKSIDLNADVGEGYDEVDLALFDLVTSASIACGGHAGDLESMSTSCRHAARRGIRIGAHVSYPDPDNFGRVTMSMSPETLREDVHRQVQDLIAVAAGQIATVSYIKPHGALYTDIGSSPEVADAVYGAAFDLELPVMILAGVRFAPSMPIISEGFIDRGYLSDGTLIPRTEPNALITDPTRAAEQAVSLAREVESLCVHSDTPNAPELMSATRSALIEAGFEITAGD